MFIRRDGSILYFDSSKCEKNYLKLKREPRRVGWTSEGRAEKSQRIKYAKEVVTPPKATENAVAEKEQPKSTEQTKVV